MALLKITKIEIISIYKSAKILIINNKNNNNCIFVLYSI